MRGYDSIQEVIAASPEKKFYWLFDIGEDSSGNPQYHYSTRYVPDTVYNSQEYTFKIIPNSFHGMEEERPKTEIGIQSFYNADFEITNKGDVLSPTTFEGQNLIIRLVVSDGTDTDVMAAYAMHIKKCYRVFQKLVCNCEDILQGYLNGTWPNTETITGLSPLQQGTYDNMCVPKIYGTAYIPVRPIWAGDSSLADIYYMLGDNDGSPTYTITEVRTPVEAPISIWDNSYTFDQQDHTINILV